MHRLTAGYEWSRKMRRATYSDIAQAYSDAFKDLHGVRPRVPSASTSILTTCRMCNICTGMRRAAHCGCARGRRTRHCHRRKVAQRSNVSRRGVSGMTVPSSSTWKLLTATYGDAFCVQTWNGRRAWRAGRGYLRDLAISRHWSDSGP